MTTHIYFLVLWIVATALCIVVYIGCKMIGFSNRRLVITGSSLIVASVFVGTLIDSNIGEVMFLLMISAGVALIIATE